ncbi:MAG: D-alanyl-D-alanine carboxypeptidase/D-alanyl-D-alanine-endopeptidase [Sedimentisphaerales bacterium]|nr:D-alanyl-D-alanine carboxypeptidase/D-alanyl-D-alanine-endopeptidase [Sedimentisphaerales bacterium]
MFSLFWVDAGEGADGPQRVRQLLNKPANKKANFSIHFCDAGTGKTVFSHNDKSPLIPASNMKLITTAAAIDQLGADFTYKTEFGLWQGNLVIIGRGDPLIGDPVLAQRDGHDIYEVFRPLVEQLRRRELTEIPGDLLVDDTFFDNERFHPSWPVEQANRWYAAQVSALNFNDNCVDIIITPSGQINQATTYRLSPDTCYVTITNKCTSITKGSNTSGGLRPAGTNDITLTGKCRAEQTINVTIDRPGAYFGFVLAEYLLRQGIIIQGKLKIVDKGFTDSLGRLPPDFEVLYTHRTSLKEVLDTCNQRSLNMAAECLMKTCGAYYTGREEGKIPEGMAIHQGSWPAGRAAIAGFLGKLEVDPGHYKIDDGSGLSRENKISAGCMTSVLKYMFSHEQWELYRESLSTPAEGTLARRRRFNDDSYEDRIFAKTGYVNRVRTLSGYCKTNSGRWLAFSILSNNPAASNSVIDQIVKMMME